MRKCQNKPTTTLEGALQSITFEQKIVSLTWLRVSHNLKYLVFSCRTAHSHAHALVQIKWAHKNKEWPKLWSRLAETWDDEADQCHWVNFMKGLACQHFFCLLTVLWRILNSHSQHEFTAASAGPNHQVSFHHQVSSGTCTWRGVHARNS